jgi:hypothetical protein
VTEQPSEAPSASLIAWLVLMLLCVGAVAALVLLALRSG